MLILNLYFIIRDYYIEFIIYVPGSQIQTTPYVNKYLMIIKWYTQLIILEIKRTELSIKKEIEVIKNKKYNCDNLLYVSASPRRVAYVPLKSSFIPFFLSLSIHVNVLSFVDYLWIPEVSFLKFMINPGMIGTLLCSACWSFKLLEESYYYGYNTYPVSENMFYAYRLFLLSELMFFFSFFWAYCHSAFSPSEQILCRWPPFGIEPIQPDGIPMLNTLLLLTSAGTLTTSWHHYRKMRTTRCYRMSVWEKNLEFLKNKRWEIIHNPHLYNSYFSVFSKLKTPKQKHKFYLQKIKSVEYVLLNIKLSKVDCLRWLSYTIILGAVFLYGQYHEFIHAKFSISDTVYGCTFFMLTGLHGLHVFIGVIMLSLCYLKIHYGLWSSSILKHHFNFFTATIWYWHFVDVIWVAVFSLCYVWGSQIPMTPYAI